MIIKLIKDNFLTKHRAKKKVLITFIRMQFNLFSVNKINKWKVVSYKILENILNNLNKI